MVTAMSGIDVVLLSTSALLLVTGLIGCVVPVLPGPIVAYGGLLCMISTPKSPSIATLVAFGILTLVVTILDYVIPAIGAKKFKCSAYGIWGCVAGTIVGLFFFPLGLVLGPFCGAFAGELIARRSMGEAAVGGIGALLGYFSGIFIKFAACIAMVVCYVMHL